MIKRRAINTSELAEIIGYKPNSIRSMIHRIRKGVAPANTLPEMINQPGAPRWDIKEVERWLTNSADSQKNKSSPTSTQKQKTQSYVGRPRKALPAEFRV